MGMAASQARFLGLTARKSNVEYQGQQINQQRTALANESANLYNQMMGLEVPTPPSTSDYMKTIYTLDDSAFGNTSNCTITNVIKSAYGTNRYTVKLEYTEEVAEGTVSTPQIESVIRAQKTSASEQAYNTYKVKMGGSYIAYDPEACLAYTTDSDGKATQAIGRDTIYKIDETTASFNLAGYEEAKKALQTTLKDDGIEGNDDEANELYFYQNANGKNCFLTAAQLTRITEEAFTRQDGQLSDDGREIDFAPNVFYSQLAYSINKTNRFNVDAQATIEMSNSGRYTSIAIDPAQEGVPQSLQGKEFSVSTSQEMDELAYNDAHNEYEYKKSLYEQQVSELNAKTEIVQQQDKQLELRLQQLNTEENAIKTEMDSVTKVIQDNIDKTFKIFA